MQSHVCVGHEDKSVWLKLICNVILTVNIPNYLFGTQYTHAVCTNMLFKEQTCHESIGIYEVIVAYNLGRLFFLSFMCVS